MDIAHYILNGLRKKGADDVVIELKKQEAYQIKFSNNKIVKTGSELLLNLSIFMAKNKKIVMTSLKDFNKKDADKVIDNLIRFSKSVKPNKDYNGIAQGPFKYKDINNAYDKKVLDCDDVDLVNKGINIALEKAKRADGIFERYIGEDILLTSNNVEAQDKNTNLYFSIRTFAEKDASGHMNSCSRTLNKLEIENAARKASDIAKLSLNPIEGKAGKYDVVFSTMAIAPIINEIASASSIFMVESGLSFLTNKLNKKLGNFTLVDQGNLENGFNSSKFDAEGVPTQKNVIINNGILKTYLHNTSTAKKYKTKTTASAGLIAPGTFNVVLDGERGNVFDIKDGLWISNVWYTRFQNHATGDFSTIPRDGIFLIKNGEIVNSVKNLRVSENMLNIMKNIKLLGKKDVHLKSWEAETPVLAPEVLVKDVNITKPKL